MKKNYFVIGLYIAGTIAVLAAIYMIFRAFKRSAAGIASIGDTIQDNRVDREIANQSGLTVLDVQKARKIASDLATEMEVRKGQTGTWKTLVTDEEIMNIASQINSANQMRVVASIFQNEMTYNKNLYALLKSELSSGNFNKVPFIEQIIN